MKIDKFTPNNLILIEILKQFVETNEKLDMIIAGKKHKGASRWHMMISEEMKKGKTLKEAVQFLKETTYKNLTGNKAKSKDENP